MTNQDPNGQWNAAGGGYGPPGGYGGPPPGAPPGGFGGPGAPPPGGFGGPPPGGFGGPGAPPPPGGFGGPPPGGFGGPGAPPPGGFGGPPAGGGYGPPMGGMKKNHTLAIVSIVAGVMAIFCNICYIPPIVAIVTSIMAKKEIAKAPDQFEGEKLATWGMILGIAGAVIYFIGGIIYAIVVAVASS